MNSRLTRIFLIWNLIAFALFGQAVGQTLRPSVSAQFAATDPHGLRPCGNPISTEQRADLKRYLSTVSAAKADDAIQEALIAYLAKCRQGEAIDNPPAWLRTVAFKKMLKLKRHDRRLTEIEKMAGASPTDELALRSPKIMIDPQLTPEFMKLSSLIASRLTNDQLMAVHGRYVDGKTAKEIAAKMDVPETTAAARLRAGEQRMAALIDANRPPQAAIPQQNAAEINFSSQVSTGLYVGLIVIAVAIAFAFISLVGSGTASDQEANWQRAARAAAERAANNENWRHYARTKAATREQANATRYLVAR